MVSKQMPNRKKRAVDSDIPVPIAAPVQEPDQDGRGERDRTGETSGRKEGMDSPGHNAESRAARKVGEVDELFSKLKKRVNAKRSEPPKHPTENKKAARNKRKVAGNKDDIFGEGLGRPSRVGADGLKVFTEEELKVGQGGDTDLCPFDCQCCF